MGGSDAPELVRLESLPVAALLLRGGRVVAVNAAYETFMAVPASTIVGRPVEELIGLFVHTSDRSMIEDAALALFAGENEEGHVWCTVQDALGHLRSIRVEWRPAAGAGDSVVYLIDAAAEALSKDLAEGLARSAGELVRCRDEQEVLERAADALLARGFVVTTLLLRDDDPLLVYGPMRSPVPYPFEYREELERIRPRREILEELNPGFRKRRAAFFQDLGSMVLKAYPPELAGRIRSLLPSSRCVQAPLFVEDRPFGALVVTGDALTPSLAGAVEMFAELVARAIETIRLRVELVQRERLAALGEAAAVMAHEVRNPIAAILNAGTLLQRIHANAGGSEGDLVRVIAEEAARLNRLVKDLLDLGRPLTPSIRPVDLTGLARQTLSVLRDRDVFGEVPIRIEAAPPILVAIDAELVQLALGNVILNAVQASPAGSQVTLTVAERGPSGAIIVDDEGSGFPREKGDRFLEPFYTTRPTGTGIGLAVVRRVVEACAGSVEIGQSPSGGGRLTMVFPRAAEAGAA
jgi:signal transduction histidine kinase